MSIAALLSKSLDLPIVTGIHNNKLDRIQEAVTQLYQLLSDHVPEAQLHPVKAPENTLYPNCIFRQVGMDAVVINAVEVANIIRLFVLIRDKSYDNLIKLGGEIVEAIENARGANALDIDSGNYDPEEKLYYFAIELEIVYPLGVSANDPRSSIAVLYPKSEAVENAYAGGYHAQQVTDIHTLVLTAETEADLLQLSRQSRAILIGKKAHEDNNSLQYKEGNIVDIGGGLFCAIERYIETYRIKSEA